MAPAGSGDTLSADAQEQKKPSRREGESGQEVFPPSELWVGDSVPSCVSQMPLGICGISRNKDICENTGCSAHNFRDIKNPLMP